MIDNLKCKNYTKIYNNIYIITPQVHKPQTQTPILHLNSHILKNTMSTFQDFIDKLGPYPNDVNRLCRLIRLLDKRLEAVQLSLNTQQKKFQAKIKELKEKKITDIPTELKIEYDLILQKQKQMYGYAKQKQSVADQLQSVITNSYQMVKNDLRNKIKDKPNQDQNLTATKKKKKPIQPSIPKSLPKQQQFLYDNVNPRYCYCSGTGYGQMVGCESTFCEKQWFHSQCIDDKSYLSEAVWHCRDCKKLIQKYKKIGSIKEFL